MKEESVQINLTVEEANLILQGLGQLPFHDVYKIIHKIHTQFQMQVEEMNRAEDDKKGNENK